MSLDDLNRIVDSISDELRDVVIATTTERQKDVAICTGSILAVFRRLRTDNHAT